MITVLGMMTNLVKGNDLSFYHKCWKKHNSQLACINLL